MKITLRKISLLYTYTSSYVSCEDPRGNIVLHFYISKQDGIKNHSHAIVKMEHYQINIHEIHFASSFSCFKTFFFLFISYEELEYNFASKQTDNEIIFIQCISNKPMKRVLP